MKLFIDTETTGIPKFNLPPNHPDQPHIVQLGAILASEQGREVMTINVLLNQDCEIPDRAREVHGISTEFMREYGISASSVMTLLLEMSRKANTIIAHNLQFDLFMTDIAFTKLGFNHRDYINTQHKFCTMKSAMNLPGMPLNHAGGKKFPKLIEAYRYAFGEDFDGAHDAMADCRAMMRLYWWLKEKGL